MIVGELVIDDNKDVVNPTDVYTHEDFLAAEGNSSVSADEMTFSDKYVGMIGESGAVSADNDWTAWIR